GMLVGIHRFWLVLLCIVTIPKSLPRFGVIGIGSQGLIIILNGFVIALGLVKARGVIRCRTGRRRCRARGRQLGYERRQGRVRGIELVGILIILQGVGVIFLVI